MSGSSSAHEKASRVVPRPPHRATTAAQYPTRRGVIRARRDCSHGPKGDPLELPPPLRPPPPPPPPLPDPVPGRRDRGFAPCVFRVALGVSAAACFFLSDGVGVVSAVAAAAAAAASRRRATSSSMARGVVVRGRTMRGPELLREVTARAMRAGGTADASAPGACGLFPLPLRRRPPPREPLFSADFRVVMAPPGPKALRPWLTRPYCLTVSLNGR